jgi:hypothetical protein
LERLARDKHSSLSRKKVKKFYNIGPEAEEVKGETCIPAKGGSSDRGQNNITLQFNPGVNIIKKFCP